MWDQIIFRMVPGIWIADLFSNGDLNTKLPWYWHLNGKPFNDQQIPMILLAPIENSIRDSEIWTPDLPSTSLTRYQLSCPDWIHCSFNKENTNIKENKKVHFSVGKGLSKTSWNLLASATKRLTNDKLGSTCCRCIRWHLSVWYDASASTSSRVTLLSTAFDSWVTWGSRERSSWSTYPMK